MTARVRRCYFSIPGTLPASVERELRGRSVNPVPPGVGRDGVGRFLGLLGNSPGGLEDWRFFTVIGDPLLKLRRLYREWGGEPAGDAPWRRFFACRENQAACYGGFQHHVGEHSGVKIEVLRAESPAVREPVADLADVAMPSWAAHWMLQYNPYEARVYHHDTTPPSCRGAGEKTAVVVGSNRCLLDRRLGPAIDRHDLVVRVNKAHTAGYEPHVGTRTDVLLLNAVLTGAVSGATAAPAAEVGAAGGAELWHVPRFFICGDFLGRPGYVPILESDGLFRAAREELGRRPTSGLIAVMAALKHGFASVAIAGFGPLGEEDVYSHYYEAEAGRDATHDFVAENRLLRKWVEEGRVTSLDTPAAGTGVSS